VEKGDHLAASHESPQPTGEEGDALQSSPLPTTPPAPPAHAGGG